jgi:CheY-like chemotaxis protein
MLGRPLDNRSMGEELRVLLVEDNENDVTILRRTLENHPGLASLSHVWDGAEGLRYLFQEGEYAGALRPDLIITCLNLPKINGLELLARLKEDEALRRIPVVVLTNSEREEDMVRAYDSGAASFLTKPVDRRGYDRVIQVVSDFARIGRLIGAD